LYKNAITAGFLLAGLAGFTASAKAEGLDVASAGRFATLALTCLHQEYPNHVSLMLNTDADVKPPHLQYPAFYGCLDWHSDVHGHWLLVRLLRLYPDAPFAAQARAEIAKSLTPENIAGEVAYLSQPNRASFERPYGLGWLLKLSAELRQWDDPQAKEWAAILAPEEAEVAKRIKNWVPKLNYPIRIGEHAQTAFSFGQIWDWAEVVHDDEMKALLTDAAKRYYQNDKACPISYEPNGEDFLSPCLGEADFMRRVISDKKAYGKWLSDFLPIIPKQLDKDWLKPGIVTDRSDPKLAHLDGLNLSRAWMLRGIASGLEPDDKRVKVLLQTAEKHRNEALPNVTGEHYEGGHWLGTFAVYLESKAGLK
jgi:hypothetical protein